jgi:hypothetical protein
MEYSCDIAAVETETETETETELESDADTCTDSGSGSDDSVHDPALRSFSISLFSILGSSLILKTAQFAAESGDGDDSLRRGRPRYKEIDYHELAFLEKIGSGAFGTVWRVRACAIALLTVCALVRVRWSVPVCVCVCVCG